MFLKDIHIIRIFKNVIEFYYETIHRSLSFPISSRDLITIFVNILSITFQMEKF